MGSHHSEPEPWVVHRVRALESLLIEKGLLSTEVVDKVVQTYEKDVGPMNGAKVVARAWVDPAYKGRLLENGAWEKCTLFDVNFRPSHMTPAELREGFHDLVRKLYSDAFTQYRRDEFKVQWGRGRVAV